MAASLASPRNARASRTHNFFPEGDHFRSAAFSQSRLPESSFRITPYGQETTYPYGHYQRPVNKEGPLDEVKQQMRDSKYHSRIITDDDDYSSGSESDGELDESPKRHKVKKLGVL